jgi:hypothetical protein
MQEMFRLEEEGNLEPPADWYFRQTKPLEELYDTEADPFELVNLADDPEHQETLQRMRAAHEAWVAETGDLGDTPEAELAELYWPGGEQPVTPAPLFSTHANADATTEVTIRSEVEGASVAYTLEQSDDARWKLYVAPLIVPSGLAVRARAIRYGWLESEEVSLQIAATVAP